MMMMMMMESTSMKMLMVIKLLILTLIKMPKIKEIMGGVGDSQGDVIGANDKSDIS